MNTLLTDINICLHKDAAGREEVVHEYGELRVKAAEHRTNKLLMSVAHLIEDYDSLPEGFKSNEEEKKN